MKLKAQRLKLKGSTNGQAPVTRAATIGAWFLLLPLAFSLCPLVFSATAARPQPLLTTPGKVLVSEDFSGTEIPKTFRTLESAASFSIVDGALQAVSRAGQERSTHGIFLAKAHDLTISFAVKFAVPGTLYIGVDGYKETFKGNTHLVRFSLSPERMAWDQHRGGPESKHAVGEAMKSARAAKQPIPKATAEQLADPNFFRIEELASKPVTCAVGEWHEVLIEVSGNELVAQMDGEKLLATAAEADAMKSRIGVGLTGRGTVLIDRVRISENTRRPDWEQVKAKLATRGGAASVRLGQAGEAAVRQVYDIGPKATKVINGTTRIFDGPNDVAVSEVKNVKYLSYTEQLKDTLAYAQENRLRFDLYILGGANGTTLSGRLADEVAKGAIKLRRIP